MTERIAIVGGGTMGAGIALVAARAGYDVSVVEPQESARERALDYLRSEAERSGDLSILDRTTWLREIPSSCDAALAIEAVPERFELKRSVLAALAKALSPGALLATNTSSLSVGDLADGVAHPERVVGLHFFNPPARMQLVEVVQSPFTGDDAVERAFAIVERLGKHGVLTGDTPGFIVNRIARPYYLQSLRALECGVASAEELDCLARGAGFRMGPFELMDLIGLDVNLATSESIYERTLAPRFEPAGLQREMVAQGLLGRKTGAGFYSYRDGRADRFEPAVAPELPPDAGEIVAVVGFGARADEIADAIEARYLRVQRISTDDRLDELAPETTIVIDAGDGIADRGDVAAQFDAVLGAESILFVDAYATDLSACSVRLRHPERIVGFGVLGTLAGQRTVEIVNSELVADDALELAQELFGGLGKSTVLVEDAPALFLGRTIGSIVNEAMIAVGENVASPEDIDTAMQLGANYPMGPIAWGREIGGARLRRILGRLADAQGEDFAPHRSLWVLDVEDAPELEPSPQ